MVGVSKFVFDLGIKAIGNVFKSHLAMLEVSRTVTHFFLYFHNID